MKYCLFVFTQVCVYADSHVCTCFQGKITISCFIPLGLSAISSWDCICQWPGTCQQGFDGGSVSPEFCCIYLPRTGITCMHPHLSWFCYCCWFLLLLLLLICLFYIWSGCQIKALILTKKKINLEIELSPHTTLTMFYLQEFRMFSNDTI